MWVGLDVLKVLRDCVRGAGKVSGAHKLILLCVLNPLNSQSVSGWFDKDDFHCVVSPAVAFRTN